MSGKNGTTATSPAAPPELLPLEDLPLNGSLDAGLTYGLWMEIPALSWTMALEGGQLHVRGTHPDSSAATTPTPAIGRLLRTVVRENGAAPFQRVEPLPALDGTLHHYLVIGFPVVAVNGASHVCMAGVAIDVTHQQMRLKDLARLALVDELTGLYNLRGFQLFAEHELKGARRRRTVSAIVYVDVDGLKEVNDTRGHGVGDAQLVATATLLRQVFRECDVIGRLGGDEFVVLAADVMGDPQNLVQRLRAAMPAAGMRADGTQDLSMSIGVASCPRDATLPLADLIAAADQAMYRSKPRKLGRMSLEAAAASIRQMLASTKAGPPGTST